MSPRLEKVNTSHNKSVMFVHDRQSSTVVLWKIVDSNTLSVYVFIVFMIFSIIVDNSISKKNVRRMLQAFPPLNNVQMTTNHVVLYRHSLSIVSLPTVGAGVESCWSSLIV